MTRKTATISIMTMFALAFAINAFAITLPDYGSCSSTSNGGCFESSYSGTTVKAGISGLGNSHGHGVYGSSAAQGNTAAGVMGVTSAGNQGVGVWASASTSDTALVATNYDYTYGAAAWIQGRTLIASSDLFMYTAGKGIVLKSAQSSNCYRLTVSDSGALITTAVTCP